MINTDKARRRKAHKNNLPSNSNVGSQFKCPFYNIKKIIKEFTEFLFETRTRVTFTSQEMTLFFSNIVVGTVPGSFQTIFMFFYL